MVSGYCAVNAQLGHRENHMKSATKKTTRKAKKPLTELELIEQKVAAHPITVVRDLHQAAASIVTLQNNLWWLKDGYEKLDKAWDVITDVRDEILAIGVEQ